MYNEEQKLRFVDDYTQSSGNRESIIRIFDLLESYETAHKKDFSCMTVKECMKVLDEISPMKSSSHWTKVSVCKAYVKWCAGKHIPDTNTELIDAITNDPSLGIDKLKTYTVSGPLQLQMYFNAIFDPESELTMDNVYRSYLWLAFCGVHRDDAYSIQSDAIDLQERLIYYRDTVLTIYNESFPAFKNAKELTFFNYKHPNYTKIITRERIPGNELLRGVKSVQNQATLNSIISHKTADAYKSGKTPLYLSYNRIYLSGLFHRAYEMERAGFHPTFEEAAALKMEGKEYSLSNRMQRIHIANKIAREYMEDYERWKLVYSV